MCLKKKPRLCHLIKAVSLTPISSAAYWQKPCSYNFFKKLSALKKNSGFHDDIGVRDLHVFFRNTDDIGLMDFGYTSVTPMSSGASIYVYIDLYLYKCIRHISLQKRLVWVCVLCANSGGTCRVQHCGIKRRWYRWHGLQSKGDVRFWYQLVGTKKKCLKRAPINGQSSLKELCTARTLVCNLSLSDEIVSLRDLGTPASLVI